MTSLRYMNILRLPWGEGEGKKLILYNFASQCNLVFGYFGLQDFGLQKLSEISIRISMNRGFSILLPQQLQDDDRAANVTLLVSAINGYGATYVEWQSNQTARAILVTLLKINMSSRFGSSVTIISNGGCNPGACSIHVLPATGGTARK